MNLDEILQYSIDEYNEETKEKFTHLFNISAAISGFPELMDNITNEFTNNDFEILKEYNKIKKDDDKFRERVVRAIMYGEKYEKQKLKKIIEDFIEKPYFKLIIAYNSTNAERAKEYALACALLDDYFVYLDTGIWNGLSTKI